MDLVCPYCMVGRDGVCSAFLSMAWLTSASVCCMITRSLVGSAFGGKNQLSLGKESAAHVSIYVNK